MSRIVVYAMTPTSTPVELLERHETLVSELQQVSHNDPEVRMWLKLSHRAMTRAVEETLPYVPQPAIVPVDTDG